MVLRGSFITSSDGSKPSDTEGARSSRLSDKGKARPPKNLFRPFGPQFGLKIKGGRGLDPPAPPLDPPLASFPNLSISLTSSRLPLLMCIVVLVVVLWFLLLFLLFFLVYGMGLWPPAQPSSFSRAKQRSNGVSYRRSVPQFARRNFCLFTRASVSVEKHYPPPPPTKKMTL